MNRIAFLLLFVSLAVGCTGRPLKVRTVRSEAMPIALVPLQPVNHPAYKLGCPDLLEVRFDDHPAWDAQVTVDVDGCLDLGQGGRVRVEGQRLEEARASIAKESRVDIEHVRVLLVEPSAKFLTVYGPEAKRQQMLVYRGPERVVDLLQRIAALKPGCTDPRDISVVRPNVALGLPSELFHVDFEAIFLDNDESTNIALQPGDQIYVGETRRSSFSRLLPNYLKPIYIKLFHLRM